jgi:hypothetical protein
MRRIYAFWQPGFVPRRQGGRANRSLLRIFLGTSGLRLKSTDLSGVRLAGTSGAAQGAKFGFRSPERLLATAVNLNRRVVGSSVTAPAKTPIKPIFSPRCDSLRCKFCPGHIGVQGGRSRHFAQSLRDHFCAHCPATFAPSRYSFTEVRFARSAWRFDTVERTIVAIFHNRPL